MRKKTLNNLVLIGLLFLSILLYHFNMEEVSPVEFPRALSNNFELQNSSKIFHQYNTNVLPYSSSTLSDFSNEGIIHSPSTSGFNAPLENSGLSNFSLNLALNENTEIAYLDASDVDYTKIYKTPPIENGGPGNVYNVAPVQVLNKKAERNKKENAPANQIARRSPFEPNSFNNNLENVQGGGGFLPPDASVPLDGGGIFVLVFGIVFGFYIIQKQSMKRHIEKNKPDLLH